MPAPLVAMRDVTRRFGSTLANDRVSLELFPGEIHALVGENGAGKTTLMRVLYGLLQPHAGHIEIDGRTVRVARPADAIRLGLGMVHQHFMLVETLTVAENLALGHEPHSRLGAFSPAAAERAAAELARRFGLAVDPQARVATLSVGAQQRVEILKALHHGARALILDEPTAVLVPQEVDELFRVLRRLRDDGAAIVLITHKLAEVRAIADRVTVMRAGRVVGGGPAAGLEPGAIAELMVGRPVPPLARERATSGARARFEVRDLAVHDERGLPAVRGASFAVREREIVGIAGVEGNGQHELIECLAGLRRAESGAVLIDGRPAPRGAAARFAAGLAHVPADRHRRGMVAEFTLAENLALGRHRDPSLGRGPALSPRTLEEQAAPLLERYDVRPPAPRLHAGALSGGNQQKMVMARELSRAAVAMLVAHPTRGVDLGATLFLHQRLLEARDAGCAILLVSSELSEILALSDRVLVMYEGRIVLERAASETDERELGRWMTGQGAAA